MASVMWFRRDLRLADNPALLAAVAADSEVVPLFVLDPALWRAAGGARLAYLTSSLSDFGHRVGALQVRRGAPVAEVVTVARAAHARTVHVAEDFGPYGRRRDEQVEQALARHGITLVRTGSPYAVSPGRIVNKTGDPYQVFTPYSRAWLQHGWAQPCSAPRDVSWVRPLASHDLPEAPLPDGLSLPPAGEAAAHRRWRHFLDEHLRDYGTARDRADLDRTSRMSVHLKWGEIHPRTMLADLATHRSESAATFRTELGWREFYADVLWRRPDSARDYYKPEFARMEYDEPGDEPADGFEAWRHGLTGYPVVDAGMRQLRTEGWMHNRVRMIVASFLVKDLHLEWQHGARHFMQWLVDGDLASNQHGWQWTAGCGTDAAPYFRVFNPTTQGQKFDPNGDYIRRYVPELRDLDARAIHQPWTLDGGPPRGYPAPIVDHAKERREALRRYQTVRR
ncbi:MAG: DNA photolyase family protein [Actinomycetota bacterium]|nr:DNA photolyase family protein [Actinomycetota bacterium]